MGPKFPTISIYTRVALYNMRVHPVTVVLHFTPKIKNGKKFNDIVSAGRCTAWRPFKNGGDVGSGPLSLCCSTSNELNTVQTPARRSAAMYFRVNFFLFLFTASSIFIRTKQINRLRIILSYYYITYV